MAFKDRQSIRGRKKKQSFRKIITEGVHHAIMMHPFIKHSIA